MKEYEIEASNLFYVSNFNVIGGVETYIYELARKYKDYDISVVYKTGDSKQIRRLMKYVKVYKYKGGFIKCKKFFCNYETDIIDKVDADYYTQLIHAMFKTNKLTPRLEPKINKYMAVSKIASEEFYELTGIKPEVCRNPLTITNDEKKPILQLISATRLTKEKGKERMKKLADELTKEGIDFIWYVFTNDEKAIDNPNVVYCKPRLNIRPLLNSIKGNGYGVQLSDCEGDCYFTRECEALGIPLIVTPIPSFKEQGLVEGVNCYFMPYDMQELNLDRIKKIPSYDGYIGEDSWINNLVKDKSNYKEVEMKVKLRVIRSYTDVQLGQDLNVGYEYTTTPQRADELLNNPNNLVEVVEYINDEPKIQKATKPKRKVTKR